MAKSPVLKKKSYLRRVGSNVYKAAKNRYASKNTSANIKNIAGDVMLLKSLLNVEKKRLQQVVVSQQVSQVNGNTGSGAATIDLTPIAGQGVTYQTRNGSSIKVTSMYLQFQFHHQTAASAPMRGCIYIVKSVGLQTVAGAIDRFLQPNHFINYPTPNIVDYNSQRNPDYFKEFVVIKKKMFRVDCDYLSNQAQIRNIQIPLKFKSHHVRYDKDTINVTAGQIFCFIVMDSGNHSATTISTITNIPITGINTGCIYNLSTQTYYVDN